MTDRVIPEISHLSRYLGQRGAPGEKLILENLEGDLDIRAYRDVRYVVKEVIGKDFIQDHLDTVANTKDLVQDIGDAFRSGMDEMTNKFLRATSLPSHRKVITQAANRGMLSPEFEIYDSKSGEVYLEKQLGWNYRLGKDNLVVVFRPPKPVDYFWDKDLPYSEPPTTSALWSYSYNHLISSVWDIWNNAPAKYGIDLIRINDVGEHEKGEYYYMWEVEKADA